MVLSNIWNWLTRSTSDSNQSVADSEKADEGEQNVVNITVEELVITPPSGESDDDD